MIHKRGRSIFIFSALSIILLFFGCMKNSLDFQVRFAALSGLQQGDNVYFESNEIGKVDAVSYTDQGDYLVTLSIVEEFKNAATVDSRFYIENDPGNQQKKAVIVVQERAGGAVLQEGAIVDGSMGSAYLSEMIKSFQKTANVASDEMRKALEQLRKKMDSTSEQLGTQLEKSLDDLSRQFQQYKNEIEKVPDSEEMLQLKQSIKQFAEEFNNAQQDVQDHLREEVIPKLRIELDRLRELLKQDGREEELEEIDKQVDEMTMV